MSLFNKKDEGIVAGEGKGEALARRAGSALAKQAREFTIGELERALLKEFPAEDAESWDRTGLLAGERSLAVGKVAVALDPTVSAVRAARAAGANVLLTHHPAFLAPPDSFAPESSPSVCSGAVVWAAIQNQVALMNFHTALDVSPRAARVLPGMLNLTFKGSFIEPSSTSRRKGYGQVCEVPSCDGEPETLGRLAARATAIFGRSPRVWGDLSRRVETAVTATGSAGDLASGCIAAGVDCLICGEIKYHAALDAREAGLCIIELGHDVSELPLVAVLADALVRIGLSQDRISILDQSTNWSYPEALRM